MVMAVLQKLPNHGHGKRSIAGRREREVIGEKKTSRRFGTENGRAVGEVVNL